MSALRSMVRGAIPVVGLLLTFLMMPRAARAQDTLYDSPHPVLKCTMQFPTAWRLSIIEGKTEKYSAFELVAPSDDSQQCLPHIVIAATSTKDAGMTTGVEYFDSFLEKAKTLVCQYAVLKRGNISYWGEQVPYVDLAYAWPLPLESSTFTWTPIRERKYATVHDGMLWTFSFAAETTQYDRYAPVFQKLMDTFFFK